MCVCVPPWLGGVPSLSPCPYHPYKDAITQSLVTVARAPLPGFVQANKWRSASTPRRRVSQTPGPVAPAAPRVQAGTVPVGWHAPAGMESSNQSNSGQRRAASAVLFRSSRMYDSQFRGGIDFPPRHPSPLPTSDRHLSYPPLAGIFFASASVGPVFIILAPAPSAGSVAPLALSPCQRSSMAPWQWCGALFLHHFLSYSRRPFAHARARPRSSPDWMARCQPATAIALICSSSCSCPSPCIYISIPLSFSCPIHPLFSITSPPLNTPVCKHARQLQMCYFCFGVCAAGHRSFLSVGGIFLFLSRSGT